MRLDKRLGWLLVGLWLVLWGLSGLGLSLGILLPILALIAGLVVLFTHW